MITISQFFLPTINASIDVESEREREIERERGEIEKELKKSDCFVWKSLTVVSL